MDPDKIERVAVKVKSDAQTAGGGGAADIEAEICELLEERVSIFCCEAPLTTHQTIILVHTVSLSPAQYHLPQLAYSLENSHTNRYNTCRNL